MRRLGFPDEDDLLLRREADLRDLLRREADLRDLLRREADLRDLLPPRLILRIDVRCFKRFSSIFFLSAVFGQAEAAKITGRLKLL